MHIRGDASGPGQGMQRVTSRDRSDARPQLVIPPDEGVLFLTQEGEILSPNRLTQLVRDYVNAVDRVVGDDRKSRSSRQGFALVAPTLIGRSDARTPEKHPGKSNAYDGIASGSPLPQRAQQHLHSRPVRVLAGGEYAAARAAANAPSVPRARRNGTRYPRGSACEVWWFATDPANETLLPAAGHIGPNAARS